MKKKLLSKDEIMAAGKTFNYYLIMEEYLDCMPWTQAERSQVKLALTTKIEYAFAKKDFKKIDKRMKELIKEIDRRKKAQVQMEEEEEKQFYCDIKNTMFRREG